MPTSSRKINTHGGRFKKNGSWKTNPRPTKQRAMARKLDANLKPLLKSVPGAIVDFILAVQNCLEFI